MGEMLAKTDWTVVVICLVLVELIKLLVGSAYKTLSGASYVSKKECEKCQIVEHGVVEEFKDDMKMMRGILLVVAVKVGVPESEYKKLV